MVTVKVDVPDEVAALIKALGHDDSFFRYSMLEGTRSWLEAAVLATPTTEKACKILEASKKQIEEEWSNKDVKVLDMKLGAEHLKQWNRIKKEWAAKSDQEMLMFIVEDKWRDT